MTLKTDFIQDFLIASSYRIARYLFLVIILVITVVGIAFSIPDEYVNPFQRVLIGVCDFIFLGIAVWVNLRWAVRRFLLQNQLMNYLVFLVVTVFLILCSIAFIQLQIYDLDKALEELGSLLLILNFVSSMLTISLILCGISTMIVLKHWIFSNEKKNELESATLQTELDNLKSQINPHFLFNMLNNANVLIKKDRKEASRMLFKLEDLLRYQMNDSSKQTVTLTSDIHFLNDFLNLEKIRRDRFECRIAKEGEIDQVSLPPLLFIPFVENAVKHSQDSEAGSYVYLSFQVEHQELLFICLNSKPAREPRKGRSGGLGLKNITRRLELLYPGKHELKIINEKTNYTVQLKLSL
ncbi:MAG: histidine kinase [Tannerellaceae bacterium]|nr:histidine kinase [Tannerellaceae bacterium]